MAASDNDVRRVDLLAKIEQSGRGKTRLKLKNLMAMFGYVAQMRVRQSSLDVVIEQLSAWGIAAACSGTSSNDFIWLSRAAASTRPPTFMGPQAPVTKAGVLIQNFNPISFAFRAVDETEHEEQALAAHVLTCVWTFRPVCLLVEASDEMFAFLSAVLGAVLRRRARMVRDLSTGLLTPSAPEVLSVEALKQLVQGRGEVGGRMPGYGSVYLVRDDASDARDDETVVMLRDSFVPHSYRYVARFASASTIEEQGENVLADGQLIQYVYWLAAFAGCRRLADQFQASTSQRSGKRAPRLDLASLMTEATQARDRLHDSVSESGFNSRYRSGFESAEHMTLKLVMLEHLLSKYGDSVKVEADYVPSAEDHERSDGEDEPKKRRTVPDLQVPGKLQVEIETLRAISFRGESPFFALERRMQPRVERMSDGEELWLIVPSDVAALAAPKIEAIVARHRVIRPRSTIRWGYVDLDAREPVFVGHEAGNRMDVTLRGASWRDTAPQDREPKAWKDVAGYADLKKHIERELLHPLRNVGRYRGYGVSSANGLLLYGLPGCGKSLVGEVIAGEAGLPCRVLYPSDLTSMWLHEGVAKVREVFDWALKQKSCIIVIDEIDAIAPQRSEHNMHSSEKREVNELLTQLDRVRDKPIVIVGTTNYPQGIDSAIRRSGRFDLKVPVFPPSVVDRAALFEHAVTKMLTSFVSGGVDFSDLARATPLFAPADIRAVVQAAARAAIRDPSATPG